MQRTTINQLEKKFNDIADAHGQIKAFQFIELQDIDTNTRMPLMWVFIADTGATQNGVVLSIPISISIMDLVNKNENNKTEVSSDCLEILKDVVSKLRQEDDLFILDENGINYKDFYEENDFEVTGWNVVVNLKIVNDFNSCDVPEVEVLTPPVNITAPVITQNGNLLTTTNGTWEGSPTITYSYKWFVDDVDSGLTDQTINWFEQSAGAWKCIVTATNNAGSSEQESNVINTGNDSFTPHADEPDDVLSHSFVANWTAGANNTGTYFLDVFQDDGTTYVGTWNNVTVAALSKLVNTGLGGNHTYKYRVRAALNFIQVPDNPTTFDNTVNVPVGTSIKDAFNAIVDSSATNTYCLNLDVGGDYEENDIHWKDYCWIKFNGATVHYGDTNAPLQDIFHAGGVNGGMIGPGSIYKSNTLGEENAYCIHADTNSPGCQFIIDDLHIETTGTGSKNAIGLGIYQHQTYVIKNCTTKSQTQEGILAHNTVGNSDGSAQLILVDTEINDIRYTNENSGSPNDFVYFKHCNIGTFTSVDNGGSETWFYVDPQCTYTALNIASPSHLLNTSEWQTFVGDNLFSISGNSNVVSVTTQSEGNLDGDNITEGTVVAGWDAKYKLLSSYSGNGVTLRRIGVEQTFPFVSNVIDQSAVNTFRAGDTLYTKTIYDQSGNGHDMINSAGDTSQPVYAADAIASGIPALISEGGGTSLKTATVIDAGDNFDVIAVINGDVGGNIGVLGSFTGGKYYMAIWQNSISDDVKLFLDSNVFVVGNSVITRGTTYLIHIESRGSVDGGTSKLYINNTLIATTPQVYTTQDFLFREFFGDELGDNLVGKNARVFVFKNAVYNDVAIFKQKTLATYNL